MYTHAAGSIKNFDKTIQKINGIHLRQRKIG